MACPTRRGISRLVGAVTVGALCLTAACGSSSTTSAATTTSNGVSSTGSTGSSATASSSSAAADVIVDLEVKGGTVVGGVREVKIDVGRSVAIRVTSDVADELHVHGYDLKRDVSPGIESELIFVADIPGVFEVELEQSGLTVGKLQVS